ncbi:MAG: M28 family peptidase [Clostridium sp.]
MIIGAAYDGVYLNDEETSYAMSAAPVATSLELAKTISELDEPLDKSVQFIFWDNECDQLKFEMKSGSYYYAIQDRKAFDMALEHGYYYFDISLPGYKEDKNLNLITLPAQLADSNNYLMGLGIQERLRELDVDFKRFFYDYETSKGVYNMRTNALTTVGLGNPSTWGINSPKDDIENINLRRMKDIGQIILDTFTMNEYMKDLNKE